MPAETSAASRCSTVSTVAPALPSTVACWTLDTSLNRRGNLNAKIGAAETDTGVGRRGFEGERHLLAGVQPDACARYLTFESPLCVHST